MEINILQNETELLGFPVIKLSEWANVTEIIDSEKDIFNEHRSAYVYCQVSATDLESIHLLENNGYQFSEFRIHSMLKTDDVEVNTRSFYPYKAALIGDEEELDCAITMLQKTKQDDRFSRDTQLESDFSTKRNIANLRKSFSNFNSEFLLGMFNSQTDELLAFRSGAYLSKHEAHYYQYAVSPNYDFAQMAEMLEAFTIEFLKQRGISIIHTISTGFNISELNRMITNHEFVISSNYLLLRKLIHK